MKNTKDSEDIYNLLLTNLKSELGKKEVSVQVLKLALDFVKTFGLQDEVKVASKGIEDFIDNLPFK